MRRHLRGIAIEVLWCLPKVTLRVAVLGVLVVLAPYAAAYDAACGGMDYLSIAELFTGIGRGDARVIQWNAATSDACDW